MLAIMVGTPEGASAGPSGADVSWSNEEPPTLGEVLIVDDTPANLQLLTNMLKEHGYKGRPVTSGPMALRAAASRPPDVILLDINMPGMDGYEVCRRLKQDRDLRDIPVLFISALTEPLDKVAAFDVGGVDFVTKPFDVQEVQARIDTHVRLRRAQVRLQTQNQTIAKSYERLREMERLRDSMAHMLAHDMRSPLTGIMTSLHFLKNDSSSNISAENLADLERGLRNVRRLVGMINDMLDVSRMEASQMPVQAESWSVAALCEEALAVLGGHSKGRKVDVADLTNLPPITCDRSLVVRVISNLVHNALKFTPTNGVVRVLGFERENTVRVEIADDGPGIPAEAQGLIFDKYAQAGLRDQVRGPASGLGLAFCKLAIEAHHGTVGVDSSEGHGSVFWFELPKGG